MKNVHTLALATNLMHIINEDTPYEMAQAVLTNFRSAAIQDYISSLEPVGEVRDGNDAKLYLENDAGDPINLKAGVKLFILE